MFTELGNIAAVSLGYKSLQNNFFYLNKATIDTFGIEKQFLTPIYMIADLDAGSFNQERKPTQWLFNCSKKKADLRGTGALRYIEAMANRAAAEKKQTGKSLTMREALEAQGGGLWYAPKAKPNKHHVWLRKAIHGSFAPFLFDQASLVDQRCNSVAPVDGLSWDLVAAALTSSLFAYSVEINGSASMGAGALEAATTKLRTYPVFDVRELKKAEAKKLIELAQKVWENEAPVDWASGEMPGNALRKLDQWLLDAAGRTTKLDTMYADLRDVCLARIAVAQDKTKKTRKKHTDNIGNVAESIARQIKPKLEMRNFPDDFAEGPRDISINIDAGSIRLISISQLLDQYDIEFTTKNGSSAYEATHPRSVAESIVRAVLWGRSVFTVSSDPAAMNNAVTAFLKWYQEIESEVDTAIRESALGTGYEDALKRAVYSLLGISPFAGAKVLPNEISLTG